MNVMILFHRFLTTLQTGYDPKTEERVMPANKYIAALYH